jgi:cell division protein ZapA
VNTRTKVEIFDQTYHVSGDLDASYVEDLARYVDAKMREIARATATVDTVRVAVLAALAIADELETLRQSRETGRDALRAHARHCLKLVERALEQTA